MKLFVCRFALGLLFIFIGCESFAQDCLPAIDPAEPFLGDEIESQSICEGETFSLDLGEVSSFGPFTFFYCDPDETTQALQLSNGNSGVSITGNQNISIGPEFYNSLLGEDPLVLDLYVTYSNGNSISNAFTLTVNPLPDQPTLNPDPAVVCSNSLTEVDLNLEPDLNVNEGGDVDILDGETIVDQNNPNYPDVISISTNSGTITVQPNLADSPPDSYTVQYTVSNNGCSASTTVEIPVIQAEDASISGVSDLDEGAVCEGSDAITPVGSPSGGDFELNGNPFSGDLDFEVPGEFNLTYISSNQTCPDTASVTYEVIELPDATITGPDDNSIFCDGSASIEISVVDDVGNFIINNDVGVVTQIDPGSLSPDSYVLTHTINNQGCSDTDEINFTIATLPTASITPSDGIYCGSVNEMLSSAGSSGNGLSYEWTGGSIGSPVTTDDLSASEFSSNNSTDSETITFNLAVTDDNNCVSNPASAVFEVLPNITGIGNSFGENYLCDGDLVSFTFENPDGYDSEISGIQVTSISSNNVTGLPNQGDVSLLTNGFSGTVGLSPDNSSDTATIVFTPYTFIGETVCLGSPLPEIEVEVRPIPDIGIISGDDEYCFGEEISISSGLEEGINLTWDYNPGGLTENSASDESLMLSLNANPSGDFGFDVSYSVELDGCTNQSASESIIIHSRPELNSEFSFDDAICKGEVLQFACEDLVVQNTGTGGFSCSITSSESTILSEDSQPQGLEPGSSVLNVGITDSNGCTIESNFTQTINVADRPVLSVAEPIDTLCAGVELIIDNQINPIGTFNLINWNYSESSDGDQISEGLPFSFQVSSIPGNGSLNIELENIFDENLSCFSNELSFDIPVIANVAFGENQTVWVCENEEETISLDPSWNGTIADDEDDIAVSWAFTGGINATVDADDYSLQISPPYTDGAIGEISGALAGCDLSSMNFEVIVFEAPQTEILNEVPLPCDGHEAVYSAVLDDENTYDYSWNLDCDDCEFDELSESAVVIQWNNTTGIGQNASLSLIQSISYEEADGLTCSREELIEFNISPNSVSCPQGLIYLPPNLLFAEDQLGDHYQWYTINDGQWTMISDALDSPYYAPSNNITSCEDGAMQYGVGVWQDGMDECEVRFNYCFDESFTDCVTNIEEKVDAESISIYPNPSYGGNLFIGFDGLAGESYDMNIYNPLGQIVFQKSQILTPTLLEIDVSFLETGVYYVAIEGASSRVSEQFIIID